MPSTGKVRITVDEESFIVEKLDALASAEGLSRNDIMRRAIRRFLFSLSSGSFEGTITPKEQPATELT